MEMEPSFVFAVAGLLLGGPEPRLLSQSPGGREKKNEHTDERKANEKKSRSERLSVFQKAAHAFHIANLCSHFSH